MRLLISGSEACAVADVFTRRLVVCARSLIVRASLGYVALTPTPLPLYKVEKADRPPLEVLCILRILGSKYVRRSGLFCVWLMLLYTAGFFC